MPKGMRCDSRPHWRRTAVAAAYAVFDTPAIRGVTGCGLRLGQATELMARGVAAELDAGLSLGARRRHR